jgi:hypothetical protein
MLVLVIIIATLSGACKSIMDICNSEYLFRHSRLKGLSEHWWLKSYSSNNKWKNRDSANGEAFFGSSTLLVFLTDAWHLFDVLRDLLFMTALVMTASYFDSIVLCVLVYVIRQIAFELIYKFLKNTTNG